MTLDVFFSISTTFTKIKYSTPLYVLDKDFPSDGFGSGWISDADTVCMCNICMSVV